MTPIIADPFKDRLDAQSRQRPAPDQWGSYNPHYQGGGSQIRIDDPGMPPPIVPSAPMPMAPAAPMSRPAQLGSFGQRRPTGPARMPAGPAQLPAQAMAYGARQKFGMPAATPRQRPNVDRGQLRNQAMEENILRALQGG